MKDLNQAQALMQTIPFKGQGFDKCREIADTADSNFSLKSFTHSLYIFLKDVDSDQVASEVLRVIQLAIPMDAIWNDPELERIA